MSSEKEKGKVFEKIRGQKVLIIGDAMIDTYMWGHVGRVSPEAPVPVVTGVIEEDRLGGAGNVALNIKAMGAVPVLCSVIGDDKRGKLFLDLMEEQNLGDVGLVMDRFRVTTQKTRIISGERQLLRVDEEMDHFLSEAVQETFIERVTDLLESGGFQAVILQDYDKGVLTPSLINRVIRKARKISVPVMADPRIRSFRAYRNLWLFTPDFNELRKGLGLEISESDVAGVAAKLKAFKKKQDIRVCMVKFPWNRILVCGGEGHVLLDDNKGKELDISGKGDTVISVATLALLAGLDEVDAACMALHAGSQVSGKAGVIPVDVGLLQDECNQHFPSS